jgi:hypothetical protein
MRKTDLCKFFGIKNRVGEFLNHTDPLFVVCRGADTMEDKFRVGDHVSWNSEAGRVSGIIIRIHVRNFDFKGYTHHASERTPQYEIRSDKSDHIAAHKAAALTLTRLGGSD